MELLQEVVVETILAREAIIVARTPTNVRSFVVTRIVDVMHGKLLLLEKLPME
jgi:hypothetical protein